MRRRCAHRPSTRRAYMYRMYMHTDRPDMQGQALHAHPDPTCQTLHDRPYMTDRLKPGQVMDMRSTMVQHSYLSAVTLPRPRAAVNATVLRSVFSDAASRKVITARAWSRLLHLATRGPAGCTAHRQHIVMTTLKLFIMPDNES